LKELMNLSFPIKAQQINWHNAKWLFLNSKMRIISWSLKRKRFCLILKTLKWHSHNKSKMLSSQMNSLISSSKSKKTKRRRYKSLSLSKMNSQEFCKMKETRTKNRNHFTKSRYQWWICKCQKRIKDFLNW